MSAEQILDLISDDESPPNTGSLARTPAAAPEVLDLCTPSPKNDPPSQSTLHTRTAVKMPSLFESDQVVTVDQENKPNVANAKINLKDSFDALADDSDDELNALYQKRKKEQKDVPKTALTSITPSDATSPPVSQIQTIIRPSNPSIRPAASSAAAIVPNVDPSAEPAINPELVAHDDQYINSSLAEQHMPEPGEADVDDGKMEVGENLRMKELLELNSKSSDASAELDTPLEMNTVLLKHQRQALAWMIKREENDKPPGHPRGGILADDQGFGKTLSTISLLFTNQPKPNANGSRRRWGSLIICPTSILYQWAGELRDRVHEQYRPRVLIYHGDKKVKNPRDLLHFDVVITTYGTIVAEYPKEHKEPDGLMSRRSPGPLYKVKWFRLVLDEAQAIRNFRRESFKAACAIRATRKWSLSGTPIQNTLNDIYSQFLFLGYHVVQSYKEWELRYKRPLEGKRGSERRFKAFQAILGIVLLRRAKHDKIDGKPVIDLPQRNTAILELEFSRTEREFYEAQEVRAVNRIQRMQDEAIVGGQSFAMALVILLRLRQACGHPALCEWGTEQEFRFSDDELDAVDIRMRTKSLFKLLPEHVSNRLYNELSPDSGVAQSCPICIDLIVGDGIVTKCGHVFCSSDFESWHRNNDSCPACRGSLGGENDAMSLDRVRKEVHALHRQKDREARAKSNTFEEFEEKVEQSVCKAEPIDLFGSLSNGIDQESETKAEPMDLGDEDEIKPNIHRGRKRRECTLKNVKSPAKKQPKLEDASSAEECSDGPSEAKKKRTSTKITKFLEEYKRIHDTTTDKALCFSQWTRMLDLIEVVLKERGYEYVRLDGSMSTNQRSDNLRLFKTRSKCRLFLISLKAGSTGLNLTEANHVFLMDSWWNPAVEDQAIDRVHRIGQKKDVHVMKLKIEKTVEDRILALQQRKKEIIDGALGVEGLKTIGRRRLNMRDLMELFESVANNVANRAEENNDGRMAAMAQNAISIARGLSGGNW